MFNKDQISQMLSGMQDSLKQFEEQNKAKTFSAKSGGGLISVSASGNGEIIDISIDDSLLEDKQSLQILLISAINDAFLQVQEAQKSSALGMLGNLDIFGNAK